MIDRAFMLMSSLTRDSRWLADHIQRKIVLEATSISVSYVLEEECTKPAEECSINNGTHTGIWLPSPTICNCCKYCLPFYRENEPCSLGGTGTGTTVGRCGDGLTCVAGDDGNGVCQRMDSPCHQAQDDYDEREKLGEIGALEERPDCDGKALYSPVICVPTQTCFCVSETGKRLFGEALYLGKVTKDKMKCGCARFHDKIESTISSGVPELVVGPRCTSDGNFHPVQCLNDICYCVDIYTGVILEGEGRMIDLKKLPIKNLTCYDPAIDHYPEQSVGEPPYNYTTPCIENIKEIAKWIEDSKKDGYNMDFHNSIPGCLPDGTSARIAIINNGTKVCIDERDQRIGEYEAAPNTPEFDEMNCKCAQTSLIMANSTEKPVCCKNGNFRRIQCRRGSCRCVDADGRQEGLESEDINSLSCFTLNWRDC